MSTVETIQKYDPDTYWDERTKKFGDLGDGYSNRDLQNYEDDIRMTKTFQVLGDISGLRVLDLGCGTGRWSVQLAKMGAIVTGIDLSNENIKLAKKRAELSHIKNIVFINEKIEDANFSDYFDIALTVTVLQHITADSDLDRAVQNIINATKKKGKILIVESTLFNKNSRGPNGNYLKFRTREEWIKLFEQKGMTFKITRDVCFIYGRYLVKYSTIYFKDKYIDLVCKKLAKLIDVHILGLGLLKRYSNPTIFLFEK